MGRRISTPVYRPQFSQDEDIFPDSIFTEKQRKRRKKGGKGGRAKEIEDRQRLLVSDEYKITYSTGLEFHY